MTNQMISLGCLGCPCGGSCGGSSKSPAALAGLAGCSCLGCPKASTCPNARKAAPAPPLGGLADYGIDVTDPKTLLIGALLVFLLYNLLFRKDQRTARSSRRKALSTARDRYTAEVSRIRAAA